MATDIIRAIPKAYAKLIAELDRCPAVNGSLIPLRRPFASARNLARG